MGGSVSLSLVGKYICRGIAVVPCRSSSVCELVVLRGECKKVNKDRSQKQGMDSRGPNESEGGRADIFIKERKENRQGGKSE